MTLAKRGGVLVADLREMGGPRLSLRTSNKDLARQLHNEIEQRVLRGEKVTAQVVRALTTALQSPSAAVVGAALGVVPKMPANSAGITMRQAFDLAKLQRDKWRTAKALHTIEANYQHVVGHFGAARTLDSITAADMRAYRAKLIAEGLAGGTVNQRMSLVSVLFEEAAEAGYPVERPAMRRISIKHQPVPAFSRELEAEIVKSFNASPVASDATMADLVVCLVDTGFRLSEMLAVEKGVTIDFSAGTIAVLDGKGGKGRKVPMTSRVHAILLRRPARPFDMLTVNRVDDRWDTMREALGRKGDHQFKVHALRHTCCNRLVQAGMDTARIKEWMGHANIATTMLYVDGQGLGLGDLRDALEGLSVRASGTAVSDRAGAHASPETRMESAGLMHTRIAS